MMLGIIKIWCFIFGHKSYKIVPRKEADADGNFWYDYVRTNSCTRCNKELI